MKGNLGDEPQRTSSSQHHSGSLLDARMADTSPSLAQDPVAEEEEDSDQEEQSGEESEGEGEE